MSKVLKVGHRGARAHEPENTIRSFKKAARLGVDVIEFDVRLTKDKVPVVIHDETVDRTTNGKGKVNELTLKQVRKLDAGKGEKVPTLEEALSFIKKNKIKAFLEIKEKGFCKKALDLVKKKKLEKQAVIISYSTNILKHVAKINKKSISGLVFKNKIKNVTGFFKLGKACNAQWLLGELKTLDKSFVKKAHDWGYKVEAWVVNDKKTAKKIARMGVDAIASDKPEVLKGL